MRMVTWMLVLWSVVGSMEAHAAPISVPGDGISLRGDLNGTGADAVILLHGDGRTRQDWAAVGASLAKAGLTVLALDLRGHGETSGAPVDDATWARMAADISAAATWLRSRGAKYVTVVGADASATVAVVSMAGSPAVDAAVMVSPRLTGHGLKITDGLAGMQGRPLLLVSGSTDTTGVRASTALAANVGGAARVQVVDGASMGPSIFTRDPAAEAQLMQWIAARGAVTATGEPANALPGVGSAAALETTGSRIGETPNP
jgi:pimeloyl-ACP methyl ester carboxylesterase